MLMISEAYINVMRSHSIVNARKSVSDLYACWVYGVKAFGSCH